MIANEKEEMSVIREQQDPDEFQQERPSSTLNDTEASLLTPEQIEEFFKATEDGSIDRLEQLFNKQTHADPNMTRFTESLLMAAIRTQRNEVAEYLIDQLAINVKYAADLREFRVHTKIPIRQRTFSCRDLAYEKGMMELVDLIDINSDEVTPSIKRYLQKRLKARLDVIHQSYLKRLKEHNKYLPFQSNKEKENREPPTVNRIDETIKPSPVLPIIHHSCRSRIEETMQSIDTSNDKSIDATGKKSFRFSNYTLRFRLIETPEKNIKIRARSPLKTIIPSLPGTPYTPLLSPPLTANNNRRPISEASTRLSIRESPGSVCQSARRTILPQIVPVENKPTMTTNTKRSSSTRVRHYNIKHSYIPQQQHPLYNQPQRFLPVTLQATATGLPSDNRTIRD